MLIFTVFEIDLIEFLKHSFILTIRNLFKFSTIIVRYTHKLNIRKQFSRFTKFGHK